MAGNNNLFGYCHGYLQKSPASIIATVSNMCLKYTATCCYSFLETNPHVDHRNVFFQCNFDHQTFAWSIQHGEYQRDKDSPYLNIIFFSPSRRKTFLNCAMKYVRKLDFLIPCYKFILILLIYSGQRQFFWTMARELY